LRTFKIILLVLMGLVLLMVAAVAALIFVEPSIYRNQLEKRASAVFNRQFKINGPIRLEKSLGFPGEEGLPVRAFWQAWSILQFCFSR
jgi:uncharacterized protein involved in outer membrane biogenesis